jgi:hypothetical protein
VLFRFVSCVKKAPTNPLLTKYNFPFQLTLYVCVFHDCHDFIFLITFMGGGLLNLQI